MTEAVRHLRTNHRFGEGLRTILDDAPVSVREPICGFLGLGRRREDCPFVVLKHSQ